MLDRLTFHEIWVVDFEYRAPPGERPDPICLCALELRSGRRLQRWRDEFGAGPPYPLGSESLFVSFAASAELSCHQVLGWRMPSSIFDPYVEFLALTNG